MMKQSEGNRFQEFFMDDKYIILKNYLYNYLLRKHAVEKTFRNEKHDITLEVGSGISPVVTADNHIVYSDLSLLALRQLKQSLGKGMYVVADGMQLPFRSGSFSHVISSEVLEHLEDDRKALNEIARVIKPFGSFIVTFPHRRFYFAKDDRFVNHFRRYELAEMEERLKNVKLYPIFVQKVLGPLEKMTMCMSISVFSIIQRFHKSSIKNAGTSNQMVIISFIFKWINRLYAGLVWLDAIIMPRALSTVLLIKAVKK
jgi:ubiquinone/menaquinone biosynthesis C-methylase UbiE